eukprot:4492661-Pleurochrysis_carterae.AAC.1
MQSNSRKVTAARSNSTPAAMSERTCERQGVIESARSGEGEKDYERKKREPKEEVNGRSRGGESRT